MNTIEFIEEIENGLEFSDASESILRFKLNGIQYAFWCGCWGSSCDSGFIQEFKPKTVEEFEQAKREKPIAQAIEEIANELWTDELWADTDDEFDDWGYDPEEWDWVNGANEEVFRLAKELKRQQNKANENQRIK